MNESLIRAGKEDLFRRGVDEIYLAMGIDRHHPLLEGVKHGLTLLKLGGYFVRLQPQQHALQAANRARCPARRPAR